MTASSPTEVVLVCMPFGPAFAPSLALSLLQAELSRHDVTSRVLYPSIRFAEIVGQHFYNGIALEGRPAQIEMAGEWIFSAALFDRPVGDDDPYIHDVLVGHANWAHRFAARPVSAALIRRIAAARRHVPAFLDWCVARIIAEQPKIVGFTSVFQQHVASLAAARRLKEAMPEVVILFGGANCEGAMGAETVRQFPFVDAAVSGEGELILPQLVARVRARETLEGLAGVRTHAAVAGGLDPAGTFSNAPGIRHMDDLPRPNYTDYMHQFRASRLDRDWTPTLYFETSRGCWWGERQHCTFCGLNGATMTYRSKSASRAVEELADMVATYPGCDIQVSDNILDLKYFKDVLPELARRKMGVKLFYETKANLKRDQIRVLRDAGVLEIQPGIESLSDGVLKLMRKGVSALQTCSCSSGARSWAWRRCGTSCGGFPENHPRTTRGWPPSCRFSRTCPRRLASLAFGWTGSARTSCVPVTWGSMRCTRCRRTDTFTVFRKPCFRISRTRSRIVWPTAGTWPPTCAHCSARCAVGGGSTPASISSACQLTTATCTSGTSARARVIT